METLKIVLIGDEKVGKTQFVHKSLNRNYQETYIPTLGCEVHPLRLDGIDKCFNLWDCAGKPQYCGLGEGYYVASNGFIIMIDASSLLSIERASSWERKVRRKFPNTPIVFIFNKSDILTPPQKEKIEEIFSHKIYFFHSNKQPSNVSNIFNSF